MSPLGRRLLAEALGSFFLLATVIGSGIMAAKLAGGNTALALLGNTLPTGAILVVLILALGPVSGAHMNPVVTAVMVLRAKLSPGDAGGYVLAQVGGAVVGVVAANLMFELPAAQIATTVRFGPGQWLAEVVATFGLVLAILGTQAANPASTPYAVGLYITAAYWFTASTSFANPAVTFARIFSDTFAGIAPGGVAPFVLAQIVGASAAHFVGNRLWPDRDA